MKNYIEFDDTNYLWHSGHIFVYINNELVENIFIDDQELSSDKLIDLLKEKYNISDVREISNYYTR